MEVRMRNLTDFEKQNSTLYVCSACRNRNTSTFVRDEEATVPEGQKICERCCKLTDCLFPINYNIGHANSYTCIENLKSIKNKKILAKNLLAIMISARINEWRLKGSYNNIAQFSNKDEFNSGKEYKDIAEWTRNISELCEFHGVALITVKQRKPKVDLVAKNRVGQLNKFFAPRKKQEQA